MQWLRMAITDCAPAAEEHTEPVKQLQLHWQHSSLSATPDWSCAQQLPNSLDIWSTLAASLTKVLPSSDEFDQSDTVMTTALAFVTEVLKYPFELAQKRCSAGTTPVVANMHAVSEEGAAGKVC